MPLQISERNHRETFYRVSNLEHSRSRSRDLTASPSLPTYQMIRTSIEQHHAPHRLHFDQAAQPWEGHENENNYIATFQLHSSQSHKQIYHVFTKSCMRASVTA
ncbi:hypothetical protein AVEN_200204-1 [Araneus ventricosus]|uniref:Uncharacterized protein n=1 Tax=Araneus ventricosus TaxID=182803 RepID=A0A4Y2P4V5_ARAVE|nr:hypothetical protein AVEN_200204-1 [Araneus ventricosus]